MKKIKADIYLETKYPGVAVAAVLLDGGTVLIDSPLSPDDSRDWLAQLKKAGASERRVLVNLDAHPDRSLGAQTLGAEAVAHRDTARQFRRRASIFKALKQETGAEWEQLSGLSGLRWVMPRVLYSEQTALQFGAEEVRIEHHPGPHPGASWALLTGAKVAFIGDTVSIKQPPFLAAADIGAWVDSLDLLLSPDYKGYKLICSRGGEASTKDVREQRRFLKDVEARLGRLAQRKAKAKESEKLAPKLIQKYKYPKKYEALYSQRLKYGLKQYYERA
jgi:glyoxylase-like metal-dependent hydrolase (beta-lactamase superfamily II)